MGSDYDHKVGILEAAITEVLELAKMLNALGLPERASVYLSEVRRLTDRLDIVHEEGS